MKAIEIKAIDQFRKAVSVLAALALVFGLLPTGATAAYAADEVEVATTLAIDGVELASDTAVKNAGYYLQASYTLTDEDGAGIAQASGVPEVKAYVGTTSQHTSTLANTADSTTGVVGFGTSKTFTEAGEYTVVLGYNWSLSATADKAKASIKKKNTENNEYYAGSKSGAIAVEVKDQQTPAATDVVGTLKNAKDGSFAVVGEGSYQYATATNFSSIYSGDWTDVPADGVVSGLPAGTYWLRGVDSVEGSGDHYTYYRGAAEDEALKVVVPEVEERQFTISLAASQHYTWRGVGAANDLSIIEGTGVRNLGVVADEGYYVESVSVEPADAATVQFDQPTGNISISNASADFALVATARSLTEPAALEVVGWELLPQDSVDALFDSNARATVQFTVKATGAFGDPAPEVPIGFSTDNDESDYDLLEFSRATDLDGLATFKVRFPVGEYAATFTTADGDYDVLSAVQPITVATQATPVLYESAITNVSAPGAADGSYRGLEDGLEYFTYPLKSTEFDAPYFRYDSTGETGGWWQAVENGEITGLSAGTYAVRAAQRADAETSTVYLFSDYATFPVANAFRTVTADAAGSSHVTFAEQSQATKQNGTVYFNVKVESGYALETSGVSVDYPAYAGSITYYPDAKKIRVTGVTRDLKLTARAVPTVKLETSNIEAIADQTYTGKAVTPAITVKVAGKTLSQGRDYTLAYANNVKAGTANVTVTGQNKYTGSVSKSFKIAKTSISTASIAAIATQAYTGKAVKPAPTVKVAGKKLAAGTDYTVTYANNVKVGTAKVTVQGKGLYAGSASKTFKIAKTSIAKATFSKIATQKLKKKGTAVKPKVTVKYAGKTLKAGTDYTLAYKNNKKKGTAKVVIAGKGRFNGTKTIKFAIK